MEIPLNAFEQYIDETILKRGLQYFKSGAVNEPVEMSGGEYEAIVEGSEDYTVKLTIKANTIQHFECECPYDGEVCKHVVAVIFYLQQEVLELSVKQTKKKGKGATKKSGKKTIAQQVDEILEKLPVERIKEYLKEHCDKNSSFRQLFLADFAYLVMEENKEMYAKKIKAIIRANTRREYIDYTGARIIGKAVYELMQSAEKHVLLGNYPSAMYISFAVLEEMTKTLEYCDDSSGSIGGAIETAMEVLENIIENCSEDGIRHEVFDFCTKSFENRNFAGWDWHFDVLEIAMNIADGEKEVVTIHKLLDSIPSNGKSWDYDYERAQGIRYELIEKKEGEAKAIAFLEDNLSNSDFRKKLIELSFEKRDFAKVIKLAEEGVRLHEKEKPGLAIDWRVYLLQVYLQLDDLKKMLKYAEYLFLNSNRDHKEYFDLLKKHTAADKWEEYIESIINIKKKSNRWDALPFIANIYIWETQWDRLFLLVKENLSLSILDSYEKYLIKDYKNEIINLFSEAILKFLLQPMEREQYKNACNYLRKLKKMGAVENVKMLVKELMVLYPRRKAMLEELAKV